MFKSSPHMLKAIKDVAESSYDVNKTVLKSGKVIDKTPAANKHLPLLKTKWLTNTPQNSTEAQTVTIVRENHLGPMFTGEGAM